MIASAKLNSTSLCKIASRTTSFPPKTKWKTSVPSSDSTTSTATAGSIFPKSSTIRSSYSSDVLRHDYPALKLGDLEAVRDEIDTNKDGRIDIDEFIKFMHNDLSALQMSRDSRQYRAVLAVKAQRRMSPNEFMNYFEKISKSLIFCPSFIADLHFHGHNLPSESFWLVRDPCGIGYVDVKPVFDTALQKMQPTLADLDTELMGYIILRSASGVPIPPQTKLSRSDIVNRAVQIGFFDTQARKFVYGTVHVAAEWHEDPEDVWAFNSESIVGTNPIAFKWADKDAISQIDVVFELVTSIKYLPSLHPSPGKAAASSTSPTAGPIFPSPNSPTLANTPSRS